MSRETIYLGLGANLGDPVAQLRRAIEEMVRRGVLIEPVRRSSLYRTPPWGVADQPWFVNAVVAGETDLSPLDLLRNLKAIETDMGRDPAAPRWGPRLIDIDILLYGRAILSAPELTLPHPQIAGRAFMLVPLLEIEPDLIDPITGIPYAKHLAGLPEANEVERLDATL